MKIFRGYDDHYKTQLRSWIGLFVVSCFFLGMVSLATPLHDTSFLLKSCSICKAQASTSSTRNKIKMDLPLSAATDNQPSWDFYPPLSQIQYNHQTPFIPALLPHAFFNKAPPYLS